jgi:hypothetical protein
MNGPDTAEGGRNPKSPTEYRRRIKSSAFFRERICEKAFGTFPRDGFPHPPPGKMPVDATVCPLSAQQREQLMPKIHRLTDN